jgi:hypothetical protein
MSPLRTFAFGPTGEDSWLAGWFPAPAGVLLTATRSGLRAREARLHGDGAAQSWRVSAEGVDIEVAPSSDQAVVCGRMGVVDGFEQAARCRGEIDGADVDAAGRRGERHEDELARSGSLREVTAWFDDGGVVAVSALRPRKAKGHEQDALRAAVVDPDGFGPVIDPRLSTTYAADGRPRRIGLELWSEAEDAPALRLAAETLVRGGSASAGGWELTVDWLATHRRGADGAGAYLVARPA